LPTKKVIDARGLFCPGPLQVVKGVIKQLESGSVLELFADDPDSKGQVTEWCNETGNELKGISEESGSITFTILVK
jgi:tRNA 2-thiouridine synthesizing protein A